MRNLLFLVLALSLASCSNDIQTNTPALQGEVNNVFFRASNSGAALNDDGSITIFGETSTQSIEITAVSTDTRSYSFDENSTSVANFTTADGAFYSTSNGINGSIDITDFSEGKVTANFNFNAVRSGLGDTLNFQRGIIFEVPVTNVVIEDEEPTGDTGDDNFTAVVDGSTFNEVNAQATVAGDLLFISAATAQNTFLTLQFPLNTEDGSYEITENEMYRASYAIGNNSQNAESGTLIITSNSVDTGNVQGTFEFTTVGGVMITNGAFNLDY